MICFNKDIKGEEVALLWVGMMMWCVVDKNIKEKGKRQLLYLLCAL